MYQRQSSQNDLYEANNEMEIPKGRYISPKKDNNLLMNLDWDSNIIMEYQKIINLFKKIKSKFRTKNWVELNDDSSETYNTNNKIKCKTTMLKKPNLSDYRDGYILGKGTAASS